MTLINLVVSKHAGITGRILRSCLVEGGARLGSGWDDQYTVSYGVHLPKTEKTLNANAGYLNKYSELTALDKAGVPVPGFSRYEPKGYPALARKFSHYKGKDISVVLQPEHARWLQNGGNADFFTQYIPFNKEYRVWVFRKSHMGTYEKVMARPREFRKVGANYKNGFSFQLVSEANIPREAVDLATRAVAALELDFGAVDILHGKDGRFYVLEVNTAPGVEGPGRQVMRSLARHIISWSTPNRKR